MLGLCGVEPPFAHQPPTPLPQQHLLLGRTLYANEPIKSLIGAGK